MSKDDIVFEIHASIVKRTVQDTPRGDRTLTQETVSVEATVLRTFPTLDEALSYLEKEAE